MVDVHCIMSFRGKYDFLSNFHPVDIIYDGVKYPSVEHAYQAAKVENPINKVKIINASSPAIAKRLAETLKDRKDWNKIKLKIMEELIDIKFQNIELRDKLLSTGNAYLIEGNWWNDVFWGCITRSENELYGENHLGRLLMERRDKLNALNAFE